MLNIRVPSIIDAPIGGRCSSATSILGDLDPINIVSGIDYILIKDGKLGLKRAFEQKPKKIFKINEIDKILLVSVHPIIYNFEVSICYTDGDKRFIL